MIKVNIKAKGRRLFIPVPYFMLHVMIAILTSKRIRAFMNHAIEKDRKTAFQIPPLSKNDLMPLLNELSEQNGLLLVETKLKDGTEVSIKL